MTVTITRHEYLTEGPDERSEMLRAAAAEAIERLEESAGEFEQAFLLTLTEAESRCLLDPLAEYSPTWRAWVSAMQVGSALFASASASEGRIEARISGKVRSIPASGPQFSAHAGNWFKALWLAVICREQDRMTQLCHVPISLLRASGAEYDEYIYACGRGWGNSTPEHSRTASPRPPTPDHSSEGRRLSRRMGRSARSVPGVVLTLHRQYWDRARGTVPARRQTRPEEGIRGHDRTRHPYPTDDVPDTLDALGEAADWILDEFADSPVLRPQALSTALTLAQQHCALDPQAVKFETWQAWVTAMQTGSALFAAATAPDGTSVTCRIKERQRVLPATGMESHVNAGAWVTSFYLAMICRDNDRLRQLADVPVSLLRDSGAVFDEYIYSWVEALQSFWLGRQDVGDKLVAAVDGTSPEARRHADADLMSKILHPPTIMLYRILRRDSAEFGKALADALRRHKEYWTADEDRATSAEGLVALGPLALACLARDQGITGEVESEYLPEALLGYSWVGEIEY